MTSNGPANGAIRYVHFPAVPPEVLERVADHAEVTGLDEALACEGLTRDAYEGYQIRFEACRMGFEEALGIATQLVAPHLASARAWAICRASVIRGARGPGVRARIVCRASRRRSRARRVRRVARGPDVADPASSGGVRDRAGAFAVTIASVAAPVCAWGPS